MTDSLLLNSLLQVIQDYERNYQKKLQDAEEINKRLERETQRLRQELDKGSSILDDVTDEILKNRLSSLSSSPLDTWIREAGVVLEDRLRRVAGEADKSLSGVQLVEAVLAPDKGTLVFSVRTGEQQGVNMLYRGAMQFIRNPPMHNIIEYQASMAQILIRLIDSLLKLLAEAKSPKHDEAKLDDIRRMLTRIPVSEWQRLLYQALYGAGQKGLNSSELAASLNSTRPQLAGILGALGVRINDTEGLENKGGVQIVFDISRLSNRDYLYRMRPVLRKALELERLV